MREPREGDPLAFVRAGRPRPWWDVDPRAIPSPPTGFLSASTTLVLAGLFAILATLPGGQGYGRMDGSTGLEYFGLHLGALLAVLALRRRRAGAVRTALWVAADLAFAGFAFLHAVDPSWERQQALVLTGVATGAGLFSLGVLGITCAASPPAMLRRAVLCNGLLIAVLLAAVLMIGLAGPSTDPRSRLYAAGRMLAWGAGAALPLGTLLGWGFVLRARAYVPCPRHAPAVRRPRPGRLAPAAPVIPATPPPPTARPRP